MSPRPPRWQEVTAIFGGTFDPPHVGHREAVRGLFEVPGVQRVLVIPSPSPPHKPAFTPVAQRVEMARLCFDSGPSATSFRMPGPVEIDLIEIDRAQSGIQQGRPTYSFDTLLELGRRTPQGAARLAFVVGADQLAAMHTWHRFPELLHLCHWIVLLRRPDGLSLSLSTLQTWEASGLVRKTDFDAAAPGGTWQITAPPAPECPQNSELFVKLVATDAPQVSSTRIREEISRNGAPPAGTLTPEIEAYLNEQRLYGSKDSKTL